ncbi:MAG: exosortase/archaeosortase family protein [Phycisphaerales bacterium]|nr:exosortase/archaeosortase family protein [Phycisphaerales bacterium]
MDTEARVNTLDADEGESPLAYASAAPPASGWWSYLGPVGVGKLLLIVALFSWFYFDHFVRLFRYWQQPDWSHGFLIPVFSLYLVHTRRSELLAGVHTGSLWGLPVMIFAVLAYAAAIYFQIGYPQPLTILIMIAGLVLLLRGWKTLWLTAFPIAFLFLAIPPPTRLYRQITQPLQQVAAGVSTFILNVFPGVAEVWRKGINIAFYMDDTSEGMFTVAGACSGMRSLMAFVALGLAMAYLTNRPTWHRVALALSVVPVALFCNILRVIITGAFQMYGAGGLSSGSPHTVLGLLMFGLGFMLFMGVLWILDHLFVETSVDESTETAQA